MGQMTIYLDDELIQRVKQTANAANLSQSQWIARLIRERTRSSWPENIRELAGSWQDFPEAEVLRTHLGIGIYTNRRAVSLRPSNCSGE
ncbi:MAG: hypothetical protein R3E95_09820 [Thiolinea sp.]